MERVIPDRVSIDPKSPHFWPDYRKLGVRINGEVRRGDVHEFCVSEGWAKVRQRTKWGYVVNGDTYALEKIEGRIEPYFAFERDPAPDRQKAAEEKRARKAAKRLRDGGAGMGARPGASYS